MNIRSAKQSATVVALALLLAGAAGCSTKPSASITGMKVQGISLTDATMLFDVKVDNPYMLPLPLGNLDYALASQGQQFLTGNSDVQGTIPAGASKTLPIPIKINYLKLISAVKGAKPGAVIPYTADLGLSVKAPVMGPLRVPMSKEGKLTIPSTSSLLNKLKDLRN
jgi:LEA14-like dessication related protein